MKEICKVAITCSGGDWRTLEAITHEGALWLVTGWLENQSLGIAKPKRIIQLAGLDLRPSPVPSVDWVLLTPIPESILHLEADQPTPAPFFSIVHPDITVELTPERSSRH